MESCQESPNRVGDEQETVEAIPVAKGEGLVSAMRAVALNHPNIVKRGSMKQGIHPTYGYVIFHDRSANTMMLTRSTLAAKASSLPVMKWEDGREYPVVNVDVSSSSHPFYTGKNVVLDTAGQVQKFNKRYQRTSK